MFLIVVRSIILLTGIEVILELFHGVRVLKSIRVLHRYRPLPPLQV